MQLYRLPYEESVIHFRTFRIGRGLSDAVGVRVVRVVGNNIRATQTHFG